MRVKAGMTLKVEEGKGGMWVKRNEGMKKLGSTKRKP
jgi:hypothetical protein